jgi:hypothetical protein
MPQLVSGPTPATRPRPVTTTVIPKLAGDGSEPGLQLASLESEGAKIEGRFGWGSAWLRAPAYDEEHPEEDSYRPFPITPFLTASASPDHPSFLQASRSGSMAQARAEPLPASELLWAQQFNGEAAALGTVLKVATKAAR